MLNVHAVSRVILFQFHYRALAVAPKQLSSWLSTMLVLPITQLVFMCFHEIVSENEAFLQYSTDSSMKDGRRKVRERDRHWKVQLPSFMDMFFGVGGSE